MIAINNVVIIYLTRTYKSNIKILSVESGSLELLHVLKSILIRID